MALITCPECKKQISETVNSCPNCGFKLTPEKVSKLKEEQTEREFFDSLQVESPQEKLSKQNEEKKNNGKLGCLLMTVLLAIIVYFMLFNDSNSDAVPDNRIEAYVMAQQFVEKNLVSPSSAKYPLAASEFTSRLEGQKYKVSAYVDSQNRFGAMIRTKFTVIVEKIDKDNWRLIDIKMSE